MENNYIRMEFSATPENIAPVRLCITTFVSNMNIPVNELMDLKTALSEAITNAVDHAYDNKEYNLNNKVIVETKIVSNDMVNIKVEDYGKGIENISLAMTPAYTSKPETEHAGMGFTIMESFMDEVIVDSKVDIGTTIYMSKTIKRKISNNITENNLKQINTTS